MRMKEAVDVFYYDYVLYRLAELYFTNSKDRDIPYYQKIAQKLLVKLRDDRVVFDAEVGLKFAYVKISDLLLAFDRCDAHADPSCCPSHCSQFIETCFGYLSKIQEEYVHLREDKTFIALYKAVVLLCILNSPSLEQFSGTMAPSSIQRLLCDPPRPCIASMQTEEEFKCVKKALLSTMGNVPTDTHKAAFSFLIEKLKSVFSSFKPPLFKYFTTREIMRLKQIYPQSLEKIDSLPSSKSGYKEQILSDYIELCDSISKARRSYTNPGTEGERVEWDSR
jgi:hypothetical protein